MDIQSRYETEKEKEAEGKMNADVVIAGAGPAASTVAGITASEGLRVIVLEKEKEIGRSPCAGYVGSMDFPDISGRVIQSKINRMTTFFPSGRHLTSPLNGFNVNRNLFDKELAVTASRQGARFYMNSEVVGFIEKEDGYSGIQTRDGKRIKAKILVGADGASSIISRLLGFNNDVATAVQYEISNCRMDPETNEVYFDTGYAPGCYAWIFPTGRDSVRVGLGIRHHLAEKSALDYLNAFIEEHPIASKKLKNALKVRLIAGIIPVGGLRKRIYQDNIVMIEDSAGMTDPVTGAGIGYSMLAGKIAAKAIVEAIKGNDLSRLKRYEQGFRRVMERHYEKSLKKRELMDSLTDNKSLEQNLPRIWVAFKEYWREVG